MLWFKPPKISPALDLTFTCSSWTSFKAYNLIRRFNENHVPPRICSGIVSGITLRWLHGLSSLYLKRNTRHASLIPVSIIESSINETFNINKMLKINQEKTLYVPVKPWQSYFWSVCVLCMLNIAGILYIPCFPQSSLYPYYSSIEYHCLKVLKISDLIFFSICQRVKWIWVNSLSNVGAKMSIKSVFCWCFLSLFVFMHQSFL